MKSEELDIVSRLLLIVVRVFTGKRGICCSPSSPSSLPCFPARLHASSLIAQSHGPSGLGVLPLHEGYQSPPSAPPPPEGETAPVAHQQDLRHTRVLPSLAREARRWFHDYQRDQGAAGGWEGRWGGNLLTSCSVNIGRQLRRWQPISAVEYVAVVGGVEASNLLGAAFSPCVSPIFQCLSCAHPFFCVYGIYRRSTLAR